MFIRFHTAKKINKDLILDIDFAFEDICKQLKEAGVEAVFAIGGPENQVDRLAGYWGFEPFGELHDKTTVHYTIHRRIL